MRKLIFVVLLLIVFLAALVIDQNVRQEAKMARSGAVAPELSSGDVLEVTIGYPPGRRPPDSAPRQSALTPRPAPEAPELDDEAESPAPAPAGPGAKAGPEAPERRLYTVKQGDTLTSIARDLLGDESKVGLLKEWNALTNPDLIRPGQVLVYFEK